MRCAVLCLLFGVVESSVDVTSYIVRGVDVSHHQKSIDWKQLAHTGVRFAYLKATEGGDFRDPRFQMNWQHSARVGLARGAYHFFTFCRRGQLQAANFISTVPKDKRALPPVVDLEFQGNCPKRPTPSELAHELQNFLSLLQNHYGKTPVIYVTHESYRRYIAGNFHTYPIWIRDLVTRPTLSDGRRWLFWQYSNRGKVPGIRGYADLNVFNGSALEFSRFADLD